MVKSVYEVIYSNLSSPLITFLLKYEIENLVPIQKIKMTIPLHSATIFGKIEERFPKLLFW